MIKTKRLILILAFLLLCAPVLGAPSFGNGNFENGTLFPWSSPYGGGFVTTGAAHSGVYGLNYTSGGSPTFAIQGFFDPINASDIGLWIKTREDIYDLDITVGGSDAYTTGWNWSDIWIYCNGTMGTGWHYYTAPIPSNLLNVFYIELGSFSSMDIDDIEFNNYYTGGATVDFNYTINMNQPKKVNFIDNSSGFTPVYYQWLFGDGTEYQGIENTVNHTYTDFGVYNVTHRATDFGGNSGENFKFINVLSMTNAGYTLILNPSQINLGDSTNIIVTSNHGFNDVDLITFYSADVINHEYFTSFRSYRKTAGVWERKNLSSEPYVATSDNPFNFGYQPETYGDKQITAYIYNLSGVYPVQYYSLLATPTEILKVITSAQNPLVNMYLYAYDVFTGAHLTNTTLTLIDYTKQGYTRTWDNVPYQQHVVLNAYDSCNLSATKEGYADNYMPFIVPNRTGNLDNPNNPPSFDQFIGVQLIPDYIPSSANNFTIVITAIDSITKQPIPSFKVNIPQFNIIRTSDNQGNQISILVPYDLAFSATVSATGYQSQTQYTGSFHPLSLKQLVFELVKITPTATPTRTPTPITTFTTRPTPQPTEGGIIVNGSFCQTPTDIVSSVKNFFCTMGFTDASAGIIIACMIMFFFACILGTLSQHALGFLVGAMIGFIMSIGLGLIPFWILLGMLGIGILVGILIMMGKSG